MNSMKGNPVVRFEIGCENSEKTQSFYQEVFGWGMSPSEHTVNVSTGSNRGISGAITSLGHEPHQYVMFYVEVDSVTETLKSILANGGTNLVGPLPTGTGQYFAWVKDPEGNQIGIVSIKK
ncbi:VOC family protein [Marinoscillum sp.]|uniref:VOC family protein n=1 Tax=Marinoscillum sp. TaxID=2024838 RepID=UPI003BAB903B